MRKPRSERAAAIHKAHAEHPHLATPEVIETRLGQHGAILRTGLIIVAVITLLSRGSFNFIRDPMERLGYQWLIPSVVPSGIRLPAVAVDFQDRFHQADGSTNLAGLSKLVDAVRKLHPSFIVVDYNFGIDPNKISNQGGEAITTATWQKNPKPPLYLASLSVGLPKVYWIINGNPDYAVHPYLPSDARDGQVYLVGDLKIDGQPAMPGMMDKLAHLTHQDLPNPLIQTVATPQTKIVIEPVNGKDSPLSATVYLFNPATLGTVASEAVDASVHDPDQNDQKNVAGRIAIIGSSTDYLDLFGRPDRSVNESGLFIATAGVASFAHEKLYIFIGTTRVILDLLSGLVIVAAVQLVLRRNIHDKREVAIERITLLATLLTVSGVIALGFALAKEFNVLWMDFILVAIVVAFHPIIDRLCHAAKHRKKISSDRIVFKQEGTEQS